MEILHPAWRYYTLNGDIIPWRYFLKRSKNLHNIFYGNVVSLAAMSNVDRTEIVETTAIGT